MPDREYLSTTTTTTPEVATSTDLETDLQDTVGNEALAELIAAQSARAPDSDLEALWEDAALAQEVQMPELENGSLYTLTQSDMEAGTGMAWTNLAKDHGMTKAHLIAFNQHIESVQSSDFADATHPISAAPEIAAGVQIYLPSADDILFSQCADRSESMSEAVSLFDSMAEAHNLEMMRTARSRASGKVGVGYGTAGDEGIFYSPNTDLAGASSRRSEVINDVTEYRVNWGPNFWKCSVFLHDVVYGAGYQPDLKENNHYQLAGRLQESDEYEEVSVANARPGDCWQRFGGTASDESHNAILSSFVEVENQDEEHDAWHFSIIGAENSRAAESERSHTMLKGKNENVQGKLIRFFRPRAKRDISATSGSS
jgi:hypothetical protein